MRRTARDILHLHAIERYRQRAVKGQCLEDDTRQAVPRMSKDEWVTSCLLCAGVPAWLLDVLGVWLCEAKGSAWTTSLVEIQGASHELRKEQVAVPFTLVEAARELGFQQAFRELRTMKQMAESQVAQNMIRHAGGDTH